MFNHDSVSGQSIRSMIRSGNILLAGNRPLKIYGTLNCGSGKRIKRANRIFFYSEDSAILAGYRPCGHCLPKKYRYWKSLHTI